ncbi:WD-40 repeat-containing protein [Apiospora saccharicola]|uniref:WD-40 repeat-containing protein n=1 Tax=Apiospora saccharicola TaxID=335842 RepID=A0ABR1U3W5_9PEZI
MEQAQLISSRKSLTLDLPPSCIEFCPASPQHFVVGTYNLQKEEAPAEDGNAGSDDDADADATQVATRQGQNRNGSLIVFQLDYDNDEVRHVQTVQQPSAILDLHFHPQKDKSDILAVVSSTGTLSFFKLDVSHGDASVTLAELATHQPLGGDGNILFLSCCWHPVLPDLISVTTSTFEVHVFRTDGAWNIFEASEEPVLAHTLEAWTVAFSPVLYEVTDQNLFTVYSGGDDSMMLQAACNLQADSPHIEAVTPVIKTKGHGAGVTAILPLDITFENKARVLLTGSYDDHFRVYAAHESGPETLAMRAKLLKESNLDGGVWRLKLVSLTRQSERWEAIVLASCMHAGSRVLKITGSSKMEECAVEVVARFEEHKSMNYGSDFQPGSEMPGGDLKIVSTSFYDKLLCFWVLPNA